jgi:hypothetical protein
VGRKKEEETEENSWGESYATAGMKYQTPAQTTPDTTGKN